MVWATYPPIGVWGHAKRLSDSLGFDTVFAYRSTIPISWRWGSELGTGCVACARCLIWGSCTACEIHNKDLGRRTRTAHWGWVPSGNEATGYLGDIQCWSLEEGSAWGPTPFPKTKVLGHDFLSMRLQSLGAWWPISHTKNGYSALGWSLWASSRGLHQL